VLRRQLALLLLLALLAHPPNTESSMYADELRNTTHATHKARHTRHNTTRDTHREMSGLRPRGC
jgi:hypothetical protein